MKKIIFVIFKIIVSALITYIQVFIAVYWLSKEGSYFSLMTSSNIYTIFVISMYLIDSIKFMLIKSVKIEKYKYIIRFISFTILIIYNILFHEIIYSTTLLDISLTIPSFFLFMVPVYLLAEINWDDWINNFKFWA